MIHRAVSGRFLLAGPAIVVPMLYEDVREALGAHLRHDGDDVTGLIRWAATGTATEFDEIAPLLVHQHEHDHVELFSGTPTGVLLAKLHQFQSGRLHYLLAKLASHFHSQTLSVRPPFFDWFKAFAQTYLPQADLRADYLNILAEIYVYKYAEDVLLSSQLENPRFAVDALNAALDCVARFQEVSQPRPIITPGDERLVVEAARWKLTGEAVFESHALMREFLLLALTHATPEVVHDWHGSRLWALGDTPTPINHGVRVLDLFEMMAQQGKPRFHPEEQRLLLDLALLAPLDPATWVPGEFPLEAVHPALRLLTLVGYCVNEGGPLPVDGLSVRDIDDVFSNLGWPTLTDLTQRACSQEPIGISPEETAAQYTKVGVRAAAGDPLRTTRASLYAGLKMRCDDPSVFSSGKHRFPMPASMEYYTDEVWLRHGFTLDTDARHNRVISSLAALWLLHGRASDFKMAVQAHNSMLGFLYRSKRARPADPDVEVASPEIILRNSFHADPPDLRELR
jgi:hypothetical protein